MAAPVPAAAAPAAADAAASDAVVSDAALPADEPEPAYRYISAGDAYALLQEQKAMALDIQPQQYYDQSGHLQGAVATFAYPANTLGLQKRLRTALAEVEAAQAVIIVDMAGKAGARNASDYYAAAGVEKTRLFILEGGMLSWPYADMRIVEIGEFTPQRMRGSDLRDRLRHDEPLILLDLRDAQAFALSHFRGAVNLPASLAALGEAGTEEALGAGFALLDATGSDGVLLISEDGGADAEFAATYYATHGIDTQRLFILKDGIAGWPESRAEYLVSDLIPSDGAAGSDAVLILG